MKLFYTDVSDCCIALCMLIGLLYFPKQWSDIVKVTVSTLYPKLCGIFSNFTSHDKSLLSSPEFILFQVSSSRLDFWKWNISDLEKKWKYHTHIPINVTQTCDQVWNLWVFNLKEWIGLLACEHNFSAYMQSEKLKVQVLLWSPW